MKDLDMWIASAVASLLFILLINVSPLAHLGFGIELPFGWHNAQTGLYHDCTEQEGLNPNLNHCLPPCNETILVDTGSPSGLPFFTTRQRLGSGCNVVSDSNNSAVLLNGLFGLAIGPVCLSIAEKRWPGHGAHTKQPKK